MSVTQLPTLQVKEFVSNAEMEHPEASLRRAADVLARLEDAVVFRGLVANPAPPPAPPFIPPAGTLRVRPIWEILDGEVSEGIYGPSDSRSHIYFKAAPRSALRANLVTAVYDAIRHLDDVRGEFSPFAVVLGNGLFKAVTIEKLALPNDIIRLLGGGSLLHSPALDILNGYCGVVVPLGGSPVELVLGADMSLDVQRVDDEPRFVFRVFEKMRLRIKRPEAIAILFGLP
jgi:uncharacterized linocin/CFP29 family protein